MTEAHTFQDSSNRQASTPPLTVMNGHFFRRGAP